VIPAAGLLVRVLLLQGVAPGDAEPTRAANPHWNPQGCTLCHANAAADLQPIPRTEIDGLCLRCHDGRQATREMHPIGRPFPEAGMVKPEGWPAPGGRLSCATCPDILSGCHRDRKRPAVNSVFVRGFDEANPLAFCARCHLENESAARYNPHRLDRGQDLQGQTACGFCHQSGIADLIGAIRTGRPKLKTSEPALCLSCHERHLDYFEPGHTGARVSSAMKSAMLAAERPHAGGIDPTLPRVAEDGGAAPSRLPLGPADTVVCSTCHNPHPQGLFPPHSVLADGAFSPDAFRDTIPLRVPAKEFCHACHNRYPLKAF
jgi:predicted CXXCH cytochrome family protein